MNHFHGAEWVWLQADVGLLESRTAHGVGLWVLSGRPDARVVGRLLELGGSGCIGSLALDYMTRLRGVRWSCDGRTGWAVGGFGAALRRPADGCDGGAS
jgi:hypothetical protein